MRPFPALATLGFAALCAASSALAAGEVYKWTNDAGVVQYTDSPPDGRPFERIKSAASREASAAGSETQAAPVAEETGLESAEGESDEEERELTESEIAQAAAAKAAAAAAAAAKETERANCNNAMANIASINAYPEIRMDRDGDGKVEILTDEQRTAELERNQALAKIYCAPAAGAEG